MSLSIHLLGVPRVERDGHAVPAPRGHKVWGLLAYLVRSERGASRAHLAELLFGDAEDPMAALRWNLSELRRLLGIDGLRGECVMLPPEAVVQVDVSVLVGGTWVEALCVPELDHDLLEGMHFSGSPSFDVWLMAERRHLGASALAVLREAALARLATGAAAEAANLAGRLVRKNPLDENFQALLVRCLAAAGDGVGAARQAAACRELFQRELGVQPGVTLDAAARTATAAPTAGPATGRAAATAQIEAGEAAIGAGALDAGLQCLRRAVVDADAAGDPMLRVRARLALGTALVHAARGRDEEGATALHEALAVGQDISPALAASACQELAHVEFLRGRYERALGWLQRADPLAAKDRAVKTRIAIVRGAVLSDTAHYPQALAALGEARSTAMALGEARLLAYALSMLGRAQLLRGDIELAHAALDESLAIARREWTAFVPWPESLRAEIDLRRGDVQAASERFEHAFALGCQLNDPCWEGIAGRGLGMVAHARGDHGQAIALLVEAVARSARLPDAYLWGTGHALDALCTAAVSQALPQAPGWVDDLQRLAASSGMRELAVRALLHRRALGDNTGDAAGSMLAGEIDSPELSRLAARAHEKGSEKGSEKGKDNEKAKKGAPATGVPPAPARSRPS